jgi:beta-lactamase superfamily II metal-dependent hydrolase
MKFQVFQSDHGDCLMITSSDGKRVLSDGGLPFSYSEHVAPALHKLQKNGEKLDVVYVSHIDQDHIAGILRMADDLVEWKIFDFQQSSGNSHASAPDVLRPPAFDKIWNNAFHDQIGKNAGPIEQMLAARARVLTLIPREFAQEAAEEHVNIAQSKAEAIRLSRRLGSKQLNVPVNPEFGGGLMFVTDPPETLDVGKLKFTVIGPFVEDLDNLRDEWNDWLGEHNTVKQLAKIRAQNKDDEEQLGFADLREALGLLLAQAAVLGDRDEVTLPNLASLMFYVEDQGGGTALLTGDGHWADILAGLEAAGKIQPGGGLHVDVLKVQHHGSENNWHHDFGRRITANHYIFCGNGSSKNPDLDVVDAVLDSRVGPASKRSTNPQTGDPFKVWFNCASSVAPPQFKSHMKKLEAKLKTAQTNHPGIVSSFFLTKSFFDLTI